MDPWLLNIFDRLKSARSAGELQAILDDLEDQYDAFSGPGLEVVEQLIAETRRRLSATPS
jgi:propanediol dehydratase small subunit